jgi:hypothetical protein
MTPVAMAVEELVPLSVSPSRFSTFSYIIRTGLVGSTVLVALLVPFFGECSAHRYLFSPLCVDFGAHFFVVFALTTIY